MSYLIVVASFFVLRQKKQSLECPFGVPSCGWERLPWS